MDNVKRIVRKLNAETSPHEDNDLSERTKENVCEGCGNVDIRESVVWQKPNLRLVVVVKPSWAPFFMCIECLSDEITEESEMTVHF